MTRNDFLTEHWKPYPAMPESFTVAGRLESIGDFHLSLEGKGQWQLSDRIALGPLKISVSELKALLRAQDWLCFFTGAEGKIIEIILLAPALQAPLQLQSTPEIQKQWFQFLQKIRLFFAGKGFQEVQTPTLVSCPGTEPFLDLFSTELVMGSRKQKYYLPTSPELHLKKMLSVGYENIFEIKNCFRNGEISERHTPEFFMLEWYRSFVSLSQIQSDVLHLLEFLGADVEKFQRKSMAELFQEKLKFSLTPQTSLEELKKLAGSLDLKAHDFEVWDDVFYLIFIERIEAFLDSEQPLFVEKYPPSQAAFARLTEDGWGERFELYWKGLEIANAFHELNDPQIQAQRFQADLALKKRLGKEMPPLDEGFMQALQSGMPPSSGIALGLERLFMALSGQKNIRQLKNFSISC